MPRNGNITGQVFDDEVINQIETRQKVLGKRSKDDKTLIYTNNQTAFLRLSSSVNIGDEVTTIYTANLKEKGGVKKLQTNSLRINEKIVSGTKILSASSTEEDIDGDGVNDKFTAEITESKLEEGKNQLKQRGIDEKMTGMELAKACVLFGGTVGVKNNLNPQLKFGIYDTTNPDPVTSIAAYGWGGLGKKGYAPMPAIDNAKVSFYNRGAIQKADVKLKVYSLEQLQIFDILYFRIGYSMLLEWGHNVWMDNKGELTNRNEFTTEPFEKFFTEGTSQQDIFKAIQKQRKDDSYNYDAMLGKVTNFTWKFNDDGTYDINLKLIGMGDIIESLKVNKAPIASGKTSLTPSEQLKKQETNAGNIETTADKRAADADKELADKQEAKQKADEELQAKIDKIQDNYNNYEIDYEVRGKSKISKIIDNAKQAGGEYDNDIPGYFDKNSQAFQDVANIFLSPDDNPWELINKLKKAKQKLEFIRTRAINSSYLAEDGRYYVSKYYDNNFNDSTGGGQNFRTYIDDALQPINKAIREIKAISNQFANNKKLALQIESAEADAEAVKAKSEQQKQAANAIRQRVQKRKDILALSPETSLETKNKSLFNQQLVAWRNEAKGDKAKGNLYKLSFTSNDTDINNSGVSVLALDFYYVRLGYMLEWIQKNLLVYDTTKKDPENKELSNPIFKLDYNSESNLCLRFPGQHSSDPRVCVVPSVYSSESSNWDVLKDLNKVSPFFVEKNDQVGKLMNIMINIDNTAGILDSNLDANGKVNLNKFLTSLFNEVNDVLGNVNKLEPVFNTEENTLTIIDANNVPNADKTFPDEEKKKATMGVFNVYGIGSEAIPNGSFVTNVDFQVQLPPNMAAMATISAQANGNIVGENATGLSKLNTGLQDRLITVKLDADSIEGAKTGKDDPTKLFNSTLELVNKSINELYAKKKFVKATVASMRSNNRDIALYITGNEEYLKKAPPPFFIPFNLKLDMQGLSGMRNYERFSITEDVLPYSYRAGDQGGVINFLIKGLSHKIDNNEWTTNIESLSVGALPNN